MSIPFHTRILNLFAFFPLRHILFGLIATISLNENFFTIFPLYSNSVNLFVGLLSIVGIMKCLSIPHFFQTLTTGKHKYVFIYFVLLVSQQFLYPSLAMNLFDCLRIMAVYFLSLAYFFNNSERDEKNELALFFKLIIVISFIYSLLSLAILFINPMYRLENGYIGIVDGRLWGFRKNPNGDGIYAALSIFCSLFLVELMRRKKWFLLFNILIQYFILVMSGARSAIIVTMIFSLGYVFEFRRKKLILSLVVIFLGFIAFSSSTRSFILSEILGGGCSTCNTDHRKIIHDSSRLKIWKSCLEAVPDNLLGVGRRNVNQGCSPYSLDRKMNEKHAHNFLIQEFVANGVILGSYSLVIWGLIVISLLRNIINFQNLKSGIFLSTFCLSSIFRGLADVDFWPSPSLLTIVFILVWFSLDKSKNLSFYNDT